MPFVKVNCSALNENLLESELFGHVKGAYSGADKTRIGRFEAAHGGTIFLDEIGEISPAIQVKLLRTLEEKEIERVGDNQPIKVDVRIISASNKDLETLVAHKRFRDDLYFRINVFPIACPPLKTRPEDIPILVQNFIHNNNLKSGKTIQGMTTKAMEKILAYEWPGNVRELRNTIDYAFVLCSKGDIGVNHLPPKIAETIPASVETRASRPSLDTNKDTARREALINALRQARGNRTETARLLGVSRVTVWKQMKKYKIDLFKDLAE
jgi:transcriptional regulator with PAS, ATPase and Fis domain